MWATVLLMAIVSGVDPAGIGAVAYIMSRPNPMRLLAAYYAGGFVVSLLAGGVVLFALGGAGNEKTSSTPPEIEIAVGALALLVALLVGTGIAARWRARAKARRHSEPTIDKSPAAQGKPSGVERLPGFEKLSQRAQNALRTESPWIAWVVGVAGGLPDAYEQVEQLFVGCRRPSSPSAKGGAPLTDTMMSPGRDVIAACRPTF